MSRTDTRHERCLTFNPVKPRRGFCASLNLEASAVIACIFVSSGSRPGQETFTGRQHTVLQSPARDEYRERNVCASW